MAYCKYTGVKFKPKKNKRKFRFGDDKQKSLGTINVRIPIQGYRIIVEKVDVVPVDVPFLIGLDFLDKYKLYVNTLENRLSGPDLNINVSLTRKLGHIYMEWKRIDKILFTKRELIKIHRNFSHPSNDKLLNLLKLARP